MPEPVHNGLTLPETVFFRSGMWGSIYIHLKTTNGYMRHEPGHAVPREWFAKVMDDYDLWVISEGNAVLSEPDGTVYELQRGSVVFFRPGSLYDLHQPQGAERLALSYFHFDVRDAEGKGVPPSYFDAIPPVLQCSTPDFSEAICQRIHQLINPWPTDPEPHHFAAHRHAGFLFKTLLADALHQHRSPVESDPALPSGLRYRQMLWVMGEIRRHPNRFRYATDVATALHISPDYANRLFMKVFRRSIQETLIAARIEKAKLFLSGSGLSVAEIAEELGYRNAYFFSRQFKQHVGETPSAFRHRGKENLPAG